jgi:hypothetical protein
MLGQGLGLGDRAPNSVGSSSVLAFLETRCDVTATFPSSVGLTSGLLFDLGWTAREKLLGSLLVLLSNLGFLGAAKRGSREASQAGRLDIAWVFPDYFNVPISSLCKTVTEFRVSRR